MQVTDNNPLVMDTGFDPHHVVGRAARSEMETCSHCGLSVADVQSSSGVCSDLGPRIRPHGGAEPRQGTPMGARALPCNFYVLTAALSLLTYAFSAFV